MPQRSLEAIVKQITTSKVEGEDESIKDLAEILMINRQIDLRHQV